MSFGYGFALPHWQTLSGGFSPASLFFSGEQGAWYDPSDLSTLFQESSGVTPVTAVEQSVGLMLDKSKGLVLGSELVSNPGPSFIATTGWTSGRAATLSVVGGVIRVTNTSPYGQAYATITTVIGTTYKVTVSVTNPTTTFDILLGSTGPEAGLLYQRSNNPAGSYTFYFSATTTTSYLTLGNSGATAGNSFDLVSATLKALPGNHAYQSTSTSRPVLRARYNLITNSENFAGSGWSGNATVATDVTTAPDGTTTADSITAATTGDNRYVRRSPAGLVVDTSYVWSVYAKKNTSDWVYVRMWDTAIGTAAWFNLATGTVGTVQAGCTATISSQGNGWYRCAITRTTGATISFNELDVAISNADNTVTATAGNSVYLWGAQLIVTNSLLSNAYQRIAAATDYNTSGFLPYLAFDGTDDSLLTNSVDFTATDKMTVWAGVRKLSDAAQGVVSELSATIASNNGSFLLTAPNSAAANYNWSSKGTTQVDNTVTTYTAPITNVVTGIADIAGASNIIRINGVQVGSVATTQGTGNFGNYPIYIGRRNNATLPLNGQLFSLIVRGAQSSAAQISSTETWVNGKTGAY